MLTASRPELIYGALRGWPIRSSAAISAASTVADQAIVSGSNVLLGILLARWLSKSDFGAYAVLFSSFTLIIGLHNAFLIEPLSVFGGGIFRDCLAVYLRRSLGVHMLLIGAIIPVAVVLGCALAPASYSAAVFSACLVLAAACSLAYVVVRRMAYTAGMRLQALTAGIVNLGVTLACLQAVRSAGTLSWTMGLLCQAAGGLVAAILLWMILTRSDLRHRAAALPFASVLKRHWSYGRWALSTAVVFWLSAEAYCALVGRLIGTEEAAGFRAVLNLTMLTPNFLAAIAVLALPHAAGLFHDGKEAEFGRFVRNFAAGCVTAAVAAAAVLWMGGPRLLGLVYGKQYQAFAGIIPALLVNMTLLSGSQAFQTEIRAMNEPRRIFEGFLMAGLCTCTLGVGLTWMYKLDGAAIGLCCSTLIFVLILAIRSRRLPVSPA